MRVTSLLVLVAGTLATPAVAERLPSSVSPVHYDLTFTVDIPGARFDGSETVRVQVVEATSRVVLHALELEFLEVAIVAGGRSQAAMVSLDAREQTATLTVPDALPPGTADIHIRYRGVLNERLRGFYLSKGKTRNYAVTQFESTDARRAFPCFDEPAFKATFAVTVVADRSDMVISNGRLLSDTPGPGAGTHTLKFATSPRMSSYLVAMAVGDFACVAGSQDGVPIRICSTPDKKHLLDVALDAARQILKFYDGYFAVKYPFGKLDVLAVPDFAAGAMENTAAIFYRESYLLADRNTASMATRKNIASVLAHEMAHQWFGDLVTMRWWDDIWLNEAFATWMANHPLAAWRPEWDIPVGEALENQAALGLDSLVSTRAIHARVETPAEIEATFDAIVYEKGAAVLRMIERYVGAEAFRTGVNAYLRAHAFGNATSADFWTAMAASSRKPVDAILPTFVNQPGLPLVSVSMACDGAADRTQVTLRQERFFVDPDLAREGSPGTWEIPVCVKGTARTSPTCDVLKGSTLTMSLDGKGCVPWVFANAGAQGYYRTEYPGDVLRALGPRVEDALTAPERLSLLEDEWALVRASRQSAADFLTLASGFEREQSSGVLNTLGGRLAFVHDYLVTDATRSAFETFVRKLLRPLFGELGLESAPRDTDARRALRAVVIAGLGGPGEDPEVIAAARATVDRVLSGNRPLDAALADPIVTIAAAHGDARLFDAYLAAAERTDDPAYHYRYLHALAGFRDPALIDRGLQYSLSPDLRRQDLALYLSKFFLNPAARALAWEFAKAHWDALRPGITIAGGDVNLVSSLSTFCDAGSRKDIGAFLADHPLPAAARMVNLTLERIDNCIQLRERQTTAVTEWLNR